MSATIASVASVSTEDDMELSVITTVPKDLVSDEVRKVMQWIIYGILLTTISIFGVVSNIINIICFVRQGLKDPVNVSLLGLAISDLGSLMMSLCVGISHNPVFQILDAPVDMILVMVYAIGPPLYLFTGATSWITALITLERCLCITMPLKVRSIITPRRINIIISCVFTLLICTVSPLYFVGSISWVFSPERNRTILSVVYTKDRSTIEQISYSVNNGFIPFSAYFIIVICTLILVVKLKNKANWRNKCTLSGNAESASKRDQKVAKMALMISILFIGCFTPVCVAAISLVAMPEVAIDGPNRNLLYIYGGFTVVLESANSSANIFIYYHMSSRYKLMFRDLFRCRKINNEQELVSA